MRESLTSLPKEFENFYAFFKSKVLPKPPAKSRKNIEISFTQLSSTSSTSKLSPPHPKIRKITETFSEEKGVIFVCFGFSFRVNLLNIILLCLHQIISKLVLII
jgi:hypothetical protein